MLYLFRNKKNTICALIFGALFSTINTAGKYLETSLALNTKQYLQIGIISLILTFVVGEIYLRIEAWVKRKFERGFRKSVYRPKHEKRYFWICVLILCLAYLPVFLAYYPGLFAYDVDTQIPQFIEGYSKHHNLIHTLYLHFFYYFVGGEVLHSFTAGIACASVLQMILFALMISYIHLFLRRVQVNFKVRAVLIGLSALLPFFSILSVSMTKDVLFTGFTGMLAVCLYYWENDEEHYREPGNLVIYLISIMGTILFRNNGIYALILSVCAGMIFIVFRKRNFRYLGFTLLGIILSLVISSGMASALSAVNGSQNEMLSIPYQQLAYVYHTEYEQLSQEEKEEIVALMPDVERYKPHISDPVKANAVGAYNKKQLLECYVKLFLKYPAEYVESFLLNNLGYLYLGDTSHASIYGADLEERSGYLLTDTKQGFGVEHRTLFAPLEKLYERMFSENKYQEGIVLEFLCSPATYFWAVILLFFYAIDLRRMCWTQFAFVFGLIATVLLGPCALIRYAFPYIICLPVLGVAVLRGETN